jgi:hypothetical protein
MDRYIAVKSPIEANSALLQVFIHPESAAVEKAQVAGAGGVKLMDPELTQRGYMRISDWVAVRTPREVFHWCWCQRAVGGNPARG